MTAPISVSKQPPQLAPKVVPFPMDQLARLISWIWDKISPLFSWIIPSKKMEATPLPPGQLADATHSASAFFTFHNRATLIKTAVALSILGAAIFHRDTLIDHGKRLFEHSYQNPSHALLGWTVSSQLVKQASFYTHSLKLNHGKLEIKLERDRVLKVSAVTLAALMISAAMYRAVNDEIEDGSLFEQAGNVAISMGQYALAKAERIWTNPFFQTPLSLSIPFTDITLWHGNLPLAIPVNISCQLINRFAIAFFHRSVLHATLLPTLTIKEYTTSAMTWKLPVTILQAIWPTEATQLESVN